MIVPVLLAGGNGTRLWPLSREGHPKQFHRLLGDHSLLQAAALRAASLPEAAPPVIICSERHRFMVAEQLREVALHEATIILEPEGRNTAPAATVAALHTIETHGKDALVFLMSADHVIEDQPRFLEATATATSAAETGRIVVFGVRPTRAETGYGYIRRGDALMPGAFELDAFIEKPNLADATRYASDERFGWNGGMFLFPAALFCQEVQRLEPEMLRACSEALARSTRDLDFLRLAPEAFAQARAESIDYAIMEHTRAAALVPLDAGWDDIGAWTFMRKLPADIDGNVSKGDVILEDCRGNLIHAEDGMVAAVGVEDHLIVATKDAVLIAPVSRSQEVKALAKRIKNAGRSEADLHPRVLRPWGSYECIAEGSRFQVKRIVVQPGQKLSLQMHHHRAEHWVVVRGTARVTRGSEEFLVTENESVFVPLGTPHRLDNPGHLPLELIEVQSGSYLGEDDIVRFDDVYGRTECNKSIPEPSSTT